MGRCNLIKKKQSSKMRRHTIDEENTDDYYMTPEEVRQSIERWSFLWHCSDSDIDSESGSSLTSPLLQHDPSAYGDWHVRGEEFNIETTGKEMLMNLSKFPYPEIIKPPVLLDTKLPKTLRVNHWPYITHKIFDYVMPDIYIRSMEFMKKPVCEGAVGYDPLYYGSSILIKPLCKYSKPRNFAPTWTNTSLVSWIDGRRFAKMVKRNDSQMGNEKLLRWTKVLPSWSNKLLAGLRKDPDAKLIARWKRPRTKFFLNSESDAMDKEWDVREEEPLPSDEFYADYVNDDPETQRSWNSSASDDFMPRITKSQPAVKRGKRAAIVTGGKLIDQLKLIKYSINALTKTCANNRSISDLTGPQIAGLSVKLTLHAATRLRRRQRLTVLLVARLLLVPSVPVYLCAKVTLVQIFLMRQSATCRLLTLLVLRFPSFQKFHNPHRKSQNARDRSRFVRVSAVKFREISAKAKTSYQGILKTCPSPRHNSNCWPMHNLSHAKLINDLAKMHLCLRTENSSS
ncbi:GM17466 [Drosophila sechellia]|uniref:GM17466 n=1 Tax=Drosophila sechellia TaxID=7238 RepID=B4IHM8_DROSE|nr:GM17466 [Drosophila sechellia]